MAARSRGPEQSQEENSSSQTNTQCGNLIFHMVNLDTFGYILNLNVVSR